MAATIGNYTKIYMDEGISESNPPGDPSAIVKFTVPTALRYTLVQDLIGTSVRAGNAIVRTFPYAYPLSPNLYCVSIESIKQIGSGFPFGIFSGIPWVGRELSIVTARFGVLKYSEDGSKDPSGKPYTTTTFDGDLELLTIPHTAYKFPSGSTTNTPLAFRIPTMTINMVKHMLPYAPVAEVASIMGNVNNAPFAIGDLTAATGTLLFSPGPIIINADTLGNLLFEATYKFAYRPIVWNAALDPNGTSGFAVPVDGSSNPILSAGDFTILP